MSRRIVAALAVATTALLPSLAVAAPADAAVNKKSCTSAAEYRRIAAGHTTSTVKRVVGNWGKVRYDQSEDVEVILEGDGFGDWVFRGDDGYDYVGDGNGDLVHVEEDLDGDGEVDSAYFEEVGAVYTTVTFRYQVRRYASCKGFNAGRATYVWFDNLSDGGSLKALDKAKSDPLAGTGLRTAPKQPSEGVLDGRTFHVAG